MLSLNLFQQGACIVAPSRQILAIGGSGLSPGVNRDAMEETFEKIGGDDPYGMYAFIFVYINT